MAIFFNNFIVKVGFKVVETIPYLVATITPLQFFRNEPISDRQDGFMHLIIMTFYVRTRQV